MTGVAIVTGGARGIGAAIAERLATDGCDVAVVDLSESACAETLRAVQARGRKALAVVADVAEEAAVEAAVERVARELGPPRVLVNNAGVLRGGLMYQLSLEDWSTVIAVNLTSVFLMSRAVQRHMQQLGGGRIVNLSSIAALGTSGQADYSAAKAGVIGLSKTMAIELGRFGITVNVVAPGFVDTQMNRDLAAGAGVPFDQLAQKMLEDIVVGRIGTVDDIAHAVAHFADDRSGFVTGQVLYVAGAPRS